MAATKRPALPPRRPAAAPAAPAKPAQRVAAPAPRSPPPPPPPPPQPAVRQQVATQRQESRAVATAAAPSFMKEDRGKGIEKLGQGDFEIPRLKLLQASSKELINYEGLRAGEFFHTTLEQALGVELLIVPVYIDIRFILWRPVDDGGGILARADDGIHWNPPDKTFDVRINKNTKKTQWTTARTVQESGLDSWGTYDPDDPNSQPAATQMYCVVALFPEHPEIPPTVITLQRTAVKPARNLMSKINISGAPSFGLQYRMGTIQQQNPNGQAFLNYTFTSEGFVTDEAEYNGYKEMYENFSRIGLAIKDLEGAQGDGVDVGGGGAAPDPQTAGRPGY